MEFFNLRKKDREGHWRKTGLTYWEYSERDENGKRHRKSPRTVLGDIPGITKIENCPHKARVAQYLERTGQLADSEDTGGPEAVSDGLS